MLEYWHWHSIHNSAETYWKGLLSHDFQPNPTYEEAKTIGREFRRLSPRLINLKKSNQVAILFSNEALTAFNAFSFGWGARENYNDVLRPIYDALYRLNVPVDFVDPTSAHLEQYQLLVVPALYAAPDTLLERLNRFVQNGGHVVYTFKSGFSDEHVKVRASQQPGIIHEACGVGYSQFVIPESVTLKDDPYGVAKENQEVKYWMELLTPTTAQVLAHYDHPVWGKYAAVTRNAYGKGTATYVGFMPGQTLLQKIMEEAVKNAGLWGTDQALRFPLITRSGVNAQGKRIHYYFNYSAEEQTLRYPHGTGTELLADQRIAKNATLTLPAWGVKIVEEK
ncbi:beta-galactosidase [Catalinimonas alkaloidigena]|uniref:Beta-galactosidase n=2 Tax=Catalinimonas alkaloidigena TaxID=1075417 RepID=A0A1G9A1D5_9BACT|nr:beta-galactosidase [Catalinimonas alkaloidigena]